MGPRFCRFSFGLLVALPLLAHADAGPKGETVADLLARVHRALGGDAAVAAVKSLSIEADCTGPGGPFRTWVRSLRPDRTYFHQVAEGHDTEIWSTPEATWTRAPDGSRKELAPGVRAFVRGHEFHLLLFELGSRFHDHRLAGAGSVEEAACQRVAMKDGTGRPASVCVREDGLPLELELNPEGARGVVRVRFHDWTTIEGARYFRSFILTEGPARTFGYRFLTIQPNSVGPELFGTWTGRPRTATRCASSRALEPGPGTSDRREVDPRSGRSSGSRLADRVET